MTRAQLHTLVTSPRDQGLDLQDEQGHDRVSLVTTAKDQGLFFPKGRGLYLEPVTPEGELSLVTKP